MKPTYAVAVVLIELLFVSCRSQLGFIRQYQQDLRPSMVRGEWDIVDEVIESSNGTVYREEDRVMYWLNRGLALHYAAQYKSSSDVLFRAEEEMQELFTKSVSEEIGKFVVSESIQTYEGEDYERTLSYLYTALNALKQNRLQDALVEARRADAFLQKMRVQFEREGNLGTLYTQDAFILWLIGYLLEMGGDYADAYLAYVASWKAYDELYASEFGVAAPQYLVEDLYRSARLAGREKEAAEWSKKGKEVGRSYQALKDGYAEVVVIQGLGEAPFKQERSFTAALPDGFVVRVAIPELVSVPTPAETFQLRLGPTTVGFERAESVASIAVNNFKKREAGIRARAVARAAIKYTTTKLASAAIKGDGEDSGRALAGDLLTIAGGLFSAAAEAADLRSWTLLPAEFEVARIWVDPGAHQLEVIALTSSGAHLGIAHREQLNLRPGTRNVISIRSVNP